MVTTSDWYPRGPRIDSLLYPRNFSGSIGSGTGSTQASWGQLGSKIRLRKLKLRLRDKRFANHKAPCTVIWQQLLQSVMALRGCSAADIIDYTTTETLKSLPYAAFAINDWHIHRVGWRFYFIFLQYVDDQWWWIVDPKIQQLVDSCLRKKDSDSHKGRLRSPGDGKNRSAFRMPPSFSCYIHNTICTTQVKHRVTYTHSTPWNYKLK